jgi:AraC-like DNA-binding protein
MAAPTKSMALAGQDFFRLMLQSLSWEYEGGSHDFRLRHDPSDWRLLPFLVIVCTVDGECVSEVEREGAHRVAAGETLLVPAGVRHTVAIPRPATVHHAHIRFSAFNSLDVLSFFKVPSVVGGVAGLELARVTAELHRIMADPSDGIAALQQAIRAQQAAFSLLAAVLAVSTPVASGLGRLAAVLRLGPVFRHLEQDMASPLDRGGLARLAGLSESRLHEIFQNAMNLSPMAYVRRARMRQAQRLLADPQLRVSEVGARVGYSEAFHFSKVFKAETGMSPRVYRDGLRQWLAGGRA